jgi:Glycosyl hydrolase family 20, domain 2
MPARTLLLTLLIICSGGALRAAVHIVPTPQYLEPFDQPVAIAPGGSVAIILGPTKAGQTGKVKLAAGFLKKELENAEPSLKIGVDSAPGSGDVRIYLWDYSANAKPGAGLSFLDREVLTAPGHYGQSYVIRVRDGKSVWVVGGTEEGVLLGAMSVLQLIQKGAEGVGIQNVYIRDYPDFRYRAAANWLMRVEVGRWSLDWGQGVDGYRQLCEQKLDEALRFKINMVVFDGFGFGLKQRFDGYGDMMRSLNQYARARGIHLVYGGYGARYAMSDSGLYLGEAWKNRVSYPDGATYECMGNDKGTCRANEPLNHLKAEELRNFVRTVEPGALYIHHEDVGLNDFEAKWKKRDDRCRKRWPNDSLSAPDGASGALAHLDSQLVEAIDSVKNPDGYDAARDCLIILVSPGYGPDSISSPDWSNTLEFWTKYTSQLPPSGNIMICFGGSSISSIFPQQYGGASWIDSFNSLMARQGSHVGTYVFVAGGAENFYSDYPLTGTAALNALYYGATGIYNASGEFYEEPMEVINAEYSWNRHSTGFFSKPTNFNDAMRLNLAYIYAKNQPQELFGPDSIFAHACELLYGPHAGPVMESYYSESAWIPDNGSEDKGLASVTNYLRSSALSSGPITESQERTVSPRGDYLPMMWDRAYSVPEYWRDLDVDSKTWSPKITDARYAADLAKLHIDAGELHRRLARQWEVLAQLNEKGAHDIDQALQAAPLPDSMASLEFLKVSFRVDQPLLEALTDFHRGMQASMESPAAGAAAKEDFQKALASAKKARDLALQEFPHPIDPNGGEVGAIRDYSARLVQSIEGML